MQNLNKNQLRWACRRGMLELDQLLMTFFDDCFDALPTDEQNTFVALLEEADQDLYNWILGVSLCANPKIQALCDRIRRHAQQTL
ncbi:MAG: succinate dehydrogenase assembly factor 2 [Gammaproteobacteria bacterium]